MTWSEDERRDLLDEAYECMRRYQQLSEARLQAGPERGTQYANEIRSIGERHRAINVRYREGLATVAMSRCPFTKEIFRHSWDPFGLDGLWWDFHKPVRPFEEPLGGRFHALSGAVQLSLASIPNTPFLIEPGPQCPFLLPRLMEYPSVRAVLSQLRLGTHTAYPIVYFSEPGLPLEDGANEWGCGRYLYRDAQGSLVTGEYFDAEDEHVYDLESWIESGRLQWIAPEDEEFELRKGLSECPYLNTPGPRKVSRMMNGKLW